MTTTATADMQDATTEELEARIDQLDAFETANQSNWGGVSFPIHDEVSSDDPDADWNSIWKIENELARRA